MHHPPQALHTAHPLAPTPNLPQLLRPPTQERVHQPPKGWTGMLCTFHICLMHTTENCFDRQPKGRAANSTKAVANTTLADTDTSRKNVIQPLAQLEAILMPQPQGQYSLGKPFIPDSGVRPSCITPRTPTFAPESPKQLSLLAELTVPSLTLDSYRSKSEQITSSK